MKMTWKTRYGFYLAAVGSAFGLGNLWRFPYIVSENGGGAFVLLYLALVFAVGLPILIAELMLGKSKRQPVLIAMSTLSSAGGSGTGEYRWVGRFSLALALLVFSYYAVISGWVLYFVVQFLFEIFAPHTQSGSLSLLTLTDSGFLQIGLASVHLILCTIICARGVHEGIERWIGAVMPLFALLLGYLLYQSLSLSTLPDALRFLFYPNFSALTWSSLGHAIGHVCFTLGVGLGTMVTFGAYMKDHENVPVAGFRVAVMDTILSLGAGLLVFPIAILASNIPLNDPGLLFQALPGFLLDRTGGALFGLTFFVCLYLAALGASLGLLEVVVANSMKLVKWPRAVVSWVAGAFVLSLSTLPALLGSLKQGDPPRSILESLDAFLINWLLPLACLAICLAISRGMKQNEMKKHFLEVKSVEAVSLYSHWMFAISWGIPALICLGLVLQIVGLF